MNYNKKNMAAALGVSHHTLMIYVKNKIVNPPQKINLPSRNYRVLWTESDLKDAKEKIKIYNESKRRRRVDHPKPPSQSTIDLINKVFK